MSSLREMCRGRWPSILGIMGVDQRYLTGRHGPCPICQAGRDRWRFLDTDGAGTWICNSCGSGDGFALLMRLRGWDFRQVATEVEAIVGRAERTEARRTRDEKRLREAMNALWCSGRPIERDDAVGCYLARRGIVLDEYPRALRYVERCRYQDEGAAEPAWYPAMIAKVTAPDGTPATIHRTYLDGRGGKAPVAGPRRLMSGRVAKGSAIRLGPVAPVLGIAEGIETALSASVIWGVPVWAAVSAGMLMAWEPPAETREVIIFGDNDGNYAGQSAAFALAHRLAMRDVKVRVEIPSEPGDWNDMLMPREQRAA